MSQATKCLILLAVVAIFFITEIIPLAVTSTAACLRLAGLYPRQAGIQWVVQLHRRPVRRDVRRRRVHVLHGPGPENRLYGR